jgi:hypothetical protein
MRKLDRMRMATVKPVNSALTRNMRHSVVIVLRSEKMSVGI